MAKAEDHDDSFNKSRMDSLSDGIFATVMTILILSLVVPVLTGPNVSSHLAESIISLLPGLLMYVFSFIVLLVMWIAHNNIFRHSHDINPRLMWINGFFLLFIGAVPFSTAFLGRYPLREPTILLYGVNFLALALMFRVLNVYIAKHHGGDNKVLRRTNRSGFVAVGTYVFAIIFSFINPYVSLAFFGFMPVFYIWQAFFGIYIKSEKSQN